MLGECFEVVCDFFLEMIVNVSFDFDIIVNEYIFYYLFFILFLELLIFLMMFILGVF